MTIKSRFCKNSTRWRVLASYHWPLIHVYVDCFRWETHWHDIENSRTFLTAFAGDAWGLRSIISSSADSLPAVSCWYSCWLTVKAKVVGTQMLFFMLRMLFQFFLELRKHERIWTASDGFYLGMKYAKLLNHYGRLSLWIWAGERSASFGISRNFRWHLYYCTTVPRSQQLCFQCNPRTPDVFDTQKLCALKTRSQCGQERTSCRLPSAVSSLLTHRLAFSQREKKRSITFNLRKSITYKRQLSNLGNWSWLGIYLHQSSNEGIVASGSVACIRRVYFRIPGIQSLSCPSFRINESVD